MSYQIPFISIVIPTRNRPEILKYALQSLLLQTFTDFEVIVCDNHTGKSCKSVFDQYSDQRFRYITPKTPLNMHDNWQFACNLARGEYVSVLMDKSIFRPSALQIIHYNVIARPAEIISWWHEQFTLDNEDVGYENGAYIPTHIKQIAPHYYDPKAELARRISCGSNVRSDIEGGSYYWGKICFGAYHHNLVERINGALGKLFFPISPDYTSMVAALAFAESAIDLGEPLSITFSSKLSNGYNSLLYPEHALKFLREIDPTDQILQKFPINGLYSSIHNSVAYDYAVMIEKVGKPIMQDLNLNMKNLVLLAMEDQDFVIWNDPRVKKNQMQILLNAYKALSIMDRISLLSQRPFLKNISKRMTSIIIELLDMFPIIKSKVKSYICKPTVTPLSCKSILDAAKLADNKYKRVSVLP